MKVLVTGGCGYIGSHTVWALFDRGHQVIALDDLSTGVRGNLPSDVPLFVGDVGNREYVDQILGTEKPDAIIHFAGKIIPAESLMDPLKYFDTNTAKSIVLIQAAIQAGTRQFLFSSTAAVYDPKVGPVVSEDSHTAPLTPYGSSKLMVEQILRSAAQSHTLQATALRYFNVAGVDSAGRCGPAGANPGHLIRTATEVALAQRPHLEIFGTDYDTPDGTCVRDYIHVSDLASAHLTALEHHAAASIGSFSVLNCGYGRGASVLEVVAAFNRVLGRPLPCEFVARRLGDAPALVANASRMRALGWRPRHEDLDGIVASALSWTRAMATRADHHISSRSPLEGAS